MKINKETTATNILYPPRINLKDLHSLIEQLKKYESDRVEVKIFENNHITENQIWIFVSPKIAKKLKTT